METELQIEVIEGQDLPAGQRKNIIAFCNRAFEEDLEPIFDTFVRPTHVLGYLAGKLASHALWVSRQLQVNNRQILRTAYVEAVATGQAYRGRGYASMIMKRLVEEIQDYQLGALSPSNPAYYERLGWELWCGPLFIRTEETLLPTAELGEVMIFRLPKTPDLDLNASLSAEWREGELW